MLKELMREPLVHFLAVAVIFFAAYSQLNAGIDNTDNIELSEKEIDSIKLAFSQRWKREPVEEEIDSAIHQHLINKGYLREAIALGFDKDDKIIDLRLRKKMDYMLESLATRTEPSDELLQAYYQQHPEKYNHHSTLSFSQVYNSEHNNSDNLSRWINEQQDNIKQKKSPVSQAVILPLQMSNATEIAIDQNFGGHFTQQLNELPLNTWLGPIESNIGTHFVKVTERNSSKRKDFDSVKNQVLEDWHYDNLQVFRDGFENKLLTKYQLTEES